MKILVTGATGFVGAKLARRMVLAGHEIVVLSRNPEQVARKLGVPCQAYQWQPSSEVPPVAALQGIDGVINMMGESLAEGRWSTERKKRIYDSRVLGTRNLVSAINRHTDKDLQFFISFSATGYYPIKSEQTYYEDDAPGNGFLAKVCKDWEAEAGKLEKAQRRLIIRLGTVLGYDGGAVAKMREIFQYGVGGTAGTGDQCMSWIHVDDLIEIVIQAITRSDFQGVINAVAPEPVSNRVISQQLARILKRPNLLPAPSWGLKLAFGEMAQLVLDSQKVKSSRLHNLGFRYRYGSIDQALEEACGVACVGLKGEKIVCERLEAYQFFPHPVEEVFEFFCDPYNLEKITPPLLSFQVKSIKGEPFGKSSVIDYRMRLHGIPMRWQSLIKEWEHNKQFVDFQTKGPYHTWHHRHQFFAIPAGTVMYDRVDYRLPLGYLGHLLGSAMVSKDVNKIFDFRYDSFKDQIGESEEPERSPQRPASNDS